MVRVRGSILKSPSQEHPKICSKEPPLFLLPGDRENAEATAMTWQQENKLKEATGGLPTQMKGIGAGLAGGPLYSLVPKHKLLPCF